MNWTIPSKPRGGRTRRPAQGGFTLIEIMLALAIFAGVLAAIYSSWFAILRGSKVALTAAADAQRSRVAVRAIEEALSCAQMSRANPGLYGFWADTSEDVARLSFVAHLPDSFPRGGRFVDRPLRRLSLDPGRDPEGGIRLELRQAPLLFELDPDEDENPLVLARGVEAFVVEFWATSPSATEWQSEWRATNQIPRLVRFTLATRTPGADPGAPPRVVSRVVLLPGMPLPGLAGPIGRAPPVAPASQPNTAAQQVAPSPGESP